MNCYFRTHISKNSGIGNYIRCLRLALNIKKHGHKITIITDNKIDKFFKKKNINYIYLYKKKNNKFSELVDANLFNEKTSIPGYIFIDDYRIGKIWQVEARNKHKKIIVIDDFLKKKNYADVIINTKPDLLIKKNRDKIFKKNKKSKILLGPKYAIIDKKCTDKIIKENSKYKIAFYFGGSGDLNHSINIIKKLFETEKDKFEISVIVGPYSKNQTRLYDLKKKYDQIKIIKPTLTLSKKIKEFDLFISSAGISVFETALYKTPSIFFVTADNQEVDFKCLEKLGHYFILEKKDLNNVNKICDLILVIFKEKKRIKKLIGQREFKIDDKGCDRLVEEIFSPVLSSSSKFKQLNNELSKKEKKNDNRTFSIQSIKDNNINQYLDAKNLLINRKYSLNKKKIEKLDHYIWWFKNYRKSFIFKKDNKEILFFFHDIVKFKSLELLIPGWYICNKGNSYLDILQGIKYQFKMLTTSKKLKDKIQIGIINKKNTSMIKFAPKLSWQLLKRDEKYFNSLSKVFNVNKSFNIYKRK